MKSTSGSTQAVKLNKKTSKKGATSIPLETLGFKAKVFYDVHEYVPRRKYNRAGKYLDPYLDMTDRAESKTSRRSCPS